MSSIHKNIPWEDPCAKCRGFFLRQGRFHRIDYEHSQSILDFQEHAANGCSFCALISQVIRSRNVRVTTPIRMQIFNGAYTGRQTIHLLLDDESFKFDILPHEDKAVEPAPAHVVWDTNNSELTKTLIRKWRDICEKTHLDCQPSDASFQDWKPTRLLQIESPKGNGPGSCKLVDGSEVPRGTGYVALSYCWGNSTFLKLESGNEHELRKGVSVSSLAKTFQHVFKVTQWLDYEYIWIDCLCIKQDRDMKDWLAESPTMNSVYSKAAITIVAAHGRDPYSGLFTDRYAKSVVPPVVQCSWDDGLIPTRAIVNSELWHNEIGLSNIASRAWTVQERALSRRLLIFGKSQVFYKCLGMKRCESYPDSEPPDIMTGYDLSALFQLKDQVSSQEQAWQTIATMYSKARLTQVGDKLMALAGVAGNFHQRFPGRRYVVGLWGVDQTHRAPELLWTTSFTGVACRLSPCIAPSWSWLSVDTQVQLRICGKDVQKVLINILEACVTPMDPKHSTGNICDNPRLHLHGKLKQAKWDLRDDLGNNDKWKYRITFDGTANPPRDNPDPSYFLSLDSISTDLAYLDIFLLPVSVRRNWETEIEGLVITPVNTQEARYRRLGYFCISETQGHRLMFQRPFREKPSLSDTEADLVEGSEATREHMDKIALDEDAQWEEIPDQLICLV